MNARREILAAQTLDRLREQANRLVVVVATAGRVGRAPIAGRGAFTVAGALEMAADFFLLFLVAAFGTQLEPLRDQFVVAPPGPFGDAAVDDFLQRLIREAPFALARNLRLRRFEHEPAPLQFRERLCGGHARTIAGGRDFAERGPVGIAALERRR